VIVPEWTIQRPRPRRGETMDIKDLNIDHERLAEICRRRQVKLLEVFGSFASGEATPESDIDFLVTFEPEWELLQQIELQEDLAVFFGRKVDLLTRSSVESSPNKYFRYFALHDTEAVFEQA